MDKDDLAWEKSDEEVESWQKSLHDGEIYLGISSLIRKYRPGQAVRLHTPIRGGYNIFYRLEYSDGSSAAMRIPCKGTQPDCPLALNVLLKTICRNCQVPRGKS